MGMFDSVMVPCPTCGNKVEFQTKAGDCLMNTFGLDDAPGNILRDIVNDPEYCAGCGNWMALVSPEIQPGPPPRPVVYPVKVRTPEKPVISPHQSSLRWWPDEEPFTYADVIGEVPGVAASSTAASRERTMMADRNGRELFLGDVVRADVDEPFRSIGPHGDWSEYEITKSPGGYALSYLRSEKGAVLPYGYLCCGMTEFGGDDLPGMKDLMFARKPVRHPRLTWIDDRTTREERLRAFEMSRSGGMKDYVQALIEKPDR